MPVRLKDIARDLGLSPMAVSKALRGHADIGKATRERVIKRASQLNYQVDWLARGLRGGQTYLVGLVVPDLMQSFFAEIAASVSAALAPHGYHVIISYTGEDAAEEVANLALLASRKVDGLIIASAQRNGRLLKRLSSPFVLIDRVISGLATPYVGSQNEEVGRIATEHLMAQGCRQIAHLRGPDVSSAAGRFQGFLRALAKGRLAVPATHIVQAGHEDRGGYRAMHRLLKSNPRPDAVFCFNDPVAVGAMRAILEAGLGIPRDIALIGVANMHFSDLLTVSLSTVDQNTAAIGKESAEQLLESMKGGVLRSTHRLIAPRLIVRASSRRGSA